jgi:hypothetical protein
MTLTPELLAELRRKAAAVGPTGCLCGACLVCAAQFRFHRHADPPTVTALVEEVERLREENAGLRRELIRERLGDDPGAEFCVMPQAAADELSGLRAEARDYEAALGRVHPVVCLVPGAMNQGECHVCAALAKWKPKQA